MLNVPFICVLLFALPDFWDKTSLKCLFLVVCVVVVLLGLLTRCSSFENTLLFGYMCMCYWKCHIFGCACAGEPWWRYCWNQRGGQGSRIVCLIIFSVHDYFSSTFFWRNKRDFFIGCHTILISIEGINNLEDIILQNQFTFEEQLS